MTADSTRTNRIDRITNALIGAIQEQSLVERKMVDNLVRRDCVSALLTTAATLAMRDIGADQKVKKADEIATNARLIAMEVHHRMNLPEEGEAD